MVASGAYSASWESMGEDDRENGDFEMRGHRETINIIVFVQSFSLSCELQVKLD